MSRRQGNRRDAVFGTADETELPPDDSCRVLARNGDRYIDAFGNAYRWLHCGDDVPPPVGDCRVLSLSGERYVDREGNAYRWKHCGDVPQETHYVLSRDGEAYVDAQGNRYVMR